MIEHIYLYLILTGATIGVVLLYLWRQARKAGRINLALIRLNEQLNFDAPAFLREAWTLLSQSGLQGMAWKLDWFGIPIEGQAGRIGGQNLYREIHVAEMKLGISLYLKSTRDERRYFDETLTETFLLLLRTDMWIKAGATDATFAQMAKLNLFLQHDMKNLAQFIQLMADQLASVPDGKEQQVLNYLRSATPLIRHRADRIVRILTLGQSHGQPLCTVDLHEELEQICTLYRLDCAISGTARVRVPENTLDSALDNILKNYSDASARCHGTLPAGVLPLITIAISEDEDGIVIRIAAANLPPVTHVERLFEPFWSSDPAGLGIGLYQAKQMLEICGGTMSARTSESGQLQFQLHLPKPGQPA